MLICPHCERQMEPKHDCRKGFTRRFFFGLIGGAVTAATLSPMQALTFEPESLVLMPGDVITTMDREGIGFIVELLKDGRPRFANFRNGRLARKLLVTVPDQKRQVRPFLRAMGYPRMADLREEPQILRKRSKEHPI